MIRDFSELFEFLLYCMGYTCSAGHFCKKNLGLPKIGEGLSAVLLFCGQVLLYAVCGYFLIPPVLADLLHHFLFAGLVIWLFSCETEKKILAVSILITMIPMTVNFSASLLSCLWLFLLHTVKNIALPFLSKLESLAISVISIFMAVSAVYGLSRQSVSVFYGKTGRWYLNLAIPLFAVTAAADLANWGASHGILFRSGGDMGLYLDQIFSHAGVCVLTGLCMCVAGCLVFGMHRIHLEQEKASQYHAQITAYKMLEEQYRQSERFRHDLKNHIIALSGLLEEKEWEKMAVYLNTMQNSADLGGCEEMTGSRVVDVLLYQKRKLAERRQIRWDCDVQIPVTCMVNEFDLCILFGNLLDNAVEACERMQDGESEDGLCPFVEIRAGAVRHCFLLEIRNSVDDASKETTGSIDEKKRNGHGIGLLNVRDVVQKYNGVMRLERQEDVFQISVLIPFPAPAAR